MLKKYKLIIIIILAFSVIVVYPMGMVPIKNFIQRAFYPISNGLVGMSGSVGDFFKNLSKIRNLTVTNNQLNDENIELNARLVELEEVAHENVILKEELGFVKEQNNTKLIPAQIVGYSPSGFLQSFKLNKGTLDGVRQNQPVISHGYLVGVISSALENSSEVFLITNSNSLIPVVLQTSRGTGLLQGGLQGLFAQEIPVDSKIILGESVLTSGLGGDLPSGIPVGNVEKIISSDAEIFQKVAIHSPVDFSRLEMVFVIGE